MFQPPLKSLPTLPERPKPPDANKTQETRVAAGNEQGQQEHTQVKMAERKSWLPSLGRSEYIVLSLCWAVYSIYTVLAYRNGGT